MGLFHHQMENVIEWEETDDNVIFHKWDNNEIKGGSKLIIRPGQKAIFYYNGVIEGVFDDPGRYDIESDIVPFLSTLKGFKFGFNSGMRAEVLFVNTKEFIIPWGTQAPVNIPAPGMPGGLPIRANGTATVKVQDDQALVAKVAGVKDEFTTKDIRQRLTTVLNPILASHIQTEGKDMFNLQANSRQIAKGMQEDFDMETLKFGMTVVSMSINSFTYPKEIQDMVTKNASLGMMTDPGKYQQVAMAESMEKGDNNPAASMASQMAGMMMGMQAAQGMMNNNSQPAGKAKFCSNCGAPANGAKFCSNCGARLG